ncbi:MAG: lactate racemase domain-containing protein, partial [Acidobacteriota bacterium]|nr:lactate racemase domain-containing protein [Acidobacteriota bacterium]
VLPTRLQKVVLTFNVMSTKLAPSTIGKGAPEVDLSPEELRAILEEALLSIGPDARVLAIIPDKTRDDNTDLLFPFAAEILNERNVAKFDALVAQGTHMPMTEAEKREKIGLRDGVALHGLGQIYDHQWNRPEELVTLGELSAERVSELTGGLINEAVEVNLNRLLAPGIYDTVLIFGATVPHEVAGFAGGAKYFFPGVAGPDLTHATHWLGALASIENVIGRVETPTRHMIEAAADFVPARIISINSVVTRDDSNRLRTHALFAGDFREAFRRATEVSRAVHIKYTGRKYRRVVALLDEHYDELWVGGKASYKLGGIIEEGGELIIYAPHLRAISETHGLLIEKYGYAPLDRVREMVALSTELQQNLAVAAHLAHVSYAGQRDEKGRVVPRYRITMASALDEATCQRVNLGYMDYRKFRREDYESDPDTLVVERAGRDLYLVEPH